MNLSPMMKFKLLQFAAKYGIHVHHYEPGFVQAYIMNWEKYETQLKKMIHKMEQYTEIEAIHFSRKKSLISITYDEAMFGNQSAIEHWFNLFEKELNQ